MKVLSSACFNDADVLPLLTIGVANGCDEVEFVAESGMKKIDIGEAVKEKQVIDKLYSLYLGNAAKVSAIHQWSLDRSARPFIYCGSFQWPYSAKPEYLSVLLAEIYLICFYIGCKCA